MGYMWDNFGVNPWETGSFCQGKAGADSSVPYDELISMPWSELQCVIRKKTRFLGSFLGIKFLTVWGWKGHPSFDHLEVHKMIEDTNKSSFSVTHCQYVKAVKAPSSPLILTGPFFPGTSETKGKGCGKSWCIFPSVAHPHVGFAYCSTKKKTWPNMWR